jgi:hypothetical protein
VGYLEIAPEFALIMGKDFIDLSRVEASPTLSELKLCILYGYPTELTNKELLTINGIAVQPISYVTSTIPTTKIKGAEPPANKDNDIFLDYPEDAEILNRGIERKIPSAPGMSGGGIWSITESSKESIWTPESYKLIAIDRSWHPSTRWVRGTLIQHWLRLIKDNYPKLANQISELLKKARPDT